MRRMRRNNYEQVELAVFSNTVPKKNRMSITMVVMAGIKIKENIFFNGDF